MMSSKITDDLLEHIQRNYVGVWRIQEVITSVGKPSSEQRADMMVVVRTKPVKGSNLTAEVFVYKTPISIRYNIHIYKQVQELNVLKSELILSDMLIV